MKKLFFKILAGILTIFLATKYINGVYLKGDLKSIFLLGTILGLFGFFFKPILKFISLPFRLLTLNIFSVLIDIGLVKLVDSIFLEFEIKSFFALFKTSLIFLILDFISK